LLLGLLENWGLLFSRKSTGLCLFAVRHFDQSMAHDLEGLAGVATGEDAFAHILCGATAVQVGEAGQYRIGTIRCWYVHHIFGSPILGDTLLDIP